jgi:cyclophilin family peptidyl-prolyl cis-trans isomerase
MLLIFLYQRVHKTLFAPRLSRPLKPRSSFSLLAALALIGVCSCIRLGGDSGNVTRPEPANDLRVTGSAAASTIFTGSSAQIAAFASGGTPPYRYRWDQNSGPEEVAFDGGTEDAIRTDPVLEVGRYVFRVVVTDAAGLHEADYVPIQAVDPVEAEVPPLAIVGQATRLTVEPDPPPGTSVRWEIAGGPAELDDLEAAEPNLTATAPGSIDLRLIFETSSSGESFITREFEIAAISNQAPRVLFETTLGDFTVELDAQRAPLHTANFLLYTDDQFYNGLLVHRVVCTTVAGAEDCEPFVIQGGGYRREDGELVEVEPTRDPVPSEADNGRTNGQLYSVALALFTGDPDSGSTQFFVNLDQDNDFLDDQGFTVFGEVVAGRDIVDAIAAAETIVSPVIPGEQSLPQTDILIERISRLAQ